MTPIETLLSAPMVQRLGWALLHFIWQGAALGLLLAVALAFLKRRSAHARYVAGCATLLLMAILPLITMSTIQVVQQSTKAVEYPVSVKPIVEEPAQSNITSQAPLLPVPSIEPQMVIPETPSVERPDAGTPSLLKGTSWSLSYRLEQWLPWVVSLWLIGVVFLSMRLLGGWIKVQNLKRKHIQPVVEDLCDKIIKISAKLMLSRPVKAVQSAAVRVPTVVGWLRPVILLPACALTGLSPQHLETIIAHELAHIKRHDYLVNLLQTVIETLLFYHPLVWWVSKRIRVERENCCDDVAVLVIGDAVTYARALNELERLRAHTPQPAVAATGGSLLNRIRRLINVRSTRTSGSPRWIAGAMTFVVILAIGISIHFTSLASGVKNDILKKEEVQKEEIEKLAESYRGFPNQIEGKFEFDVPISIQLTSGEEQSPRIMNYPRIEFNNVDGRVIATLHIRYGSWPKTKWKVKLDYPSLYAETGRVLSHAETTFENSGTIEKIPHIEEQKLRFDLGTAEQVSRAVNFRFSIESIFSEMGNPIRFDEKIPLSLELNGCEYNKMIAAEWLRFEKLEDEETVKAIIHTRYLSGPKAIWCVHTQFFNDEGEQVGQAKAIIENSGIIFGVPYLHEEDIELIIVGSPDEIAKVKRFSVSLEKIGPATSLQSTNDLQVSISMKKTRFALDEPITVKWEIENVGSEDRTLIWHELHYSPVAFEIGKKDEKKYIREDGRRFFEGAIPVPPERIMLRPNESKDAEFDLRYFGLGSDRKLGVYEIRGLYSPKDNKRLASQYLDKPEFKDVVKDRIASGIIEIEIENDGHFMSDSENLVKKASPGKDPEDSLKAFDEILKLREIGTAKDILVLEKILSDNINSTRIQGFAAAQALFCIGTPEAHKVLSEYLLSSQYNTALGIRYTSHWNMPEPKRSAFIEQYHLKNLAEDLSVQIKATPRWNDKGAWIECEVTLRNVSEENYRIQEQQVYHGKMLHFQNEAGLFIPSQEFVRYKMPMPKWLELQPGDTHTYHFSIQIISPTNVERKYPPGVSAESVIIAKTKDIVYDLARPGRFKIYAMIEMQPLTKAQRDYLDFDNPWIGRAVSEPVVVDLSLNDPKLSRNSSDSFYEIGDFKVEAGFKTDKSEVFLGEPLYIMFYVKNVGNKPIHLKTMGDYRGGRPGRYTITAVDEDGNPVFDPFIGSHRGGRVGSPQIDPGQSYSEQLLLSVWCKFEEPGNYTVTCKRTLNLRMQEGIEGEPVNKPIESVFVLNLKVPSEQQAREIVQRVISQSGVPSVDSRMPVWGKPDLSMLSHPVYMLLLLERTRVGDKEVLKGIGGIHIPEATEILIQIAEENLKSGSGEFALAALGHVVPRLPNPRYYKRQGEDNSLPEWYAKQREIVEKCWKNAFAPRVRTIARSISTNTDQTSLRLVSDIFWYIGIPDDLPYLMNAYTAAIEATKTLPLETHQYFRPRGAAYGFRFSIPQLIERGAMALTEPKTPGEAGAWLIAMKQDETFRPDDWQEQVMKWLNHETPYMRELVLTYMPEPMPETTLDMIPELLAHEDIDLQIAACHTAKKHPREDYKEPLLIILRTGTQSTFGELLNAARDAALENAVAYDQIMDIWVERLKENDLDAKAVHRLLEVIDHDGGGSFPDTLAASEMEKAQKNWKVFIDTNREKIRSGHRFKPGDPEITPDLFPEGFYFYVDGKPWPSLTP